MLAFMRGFFGDTAPQRAPRRVWNPESTLFVTDKFDSTRCAEHKRQRYESLAACRTVADAMRLTVQPTRTGPSRTYRGSDLSYDVKTGYVRVVL